MRAAALGIWLIAAPLAAQNGPQAVLTAGETLEVESRADLNGDGITDLDYIARGEGKRELRMVTSFRSAVELGENPAQVLALGPYPLGNATLAVKKMSFSSAI